MCMYSFTEYSLSTCYVPGIVPSAQVAELLVEKPRCESDPSGDTAWVAHTMADYVWDGM